MTFSPKSIGLVRLISQARYRSQQFFAAISPTVSEADRSLVREVFADNAAAIQVFERMTPGDQQHAIAVLRSLLERKQDAPALQQAALLHDVGKALGQPILYRCIIVLLKMLSPSTLRWLGQAPLDSPAWRKPFVVHRQHPSIGATWAKEAGCPALAVTLIEIHQDTPPKNPVTTLDLLHAALYQADGEH
ncbi:MAG: hypothetical protein AAF629_26050 [Chloroflexota bacterium]